MFKKGFRQIPGRFFEGTERFIEKYRAFDKRGENLFDESYQSWYENMSRSMENRKQYANEKFVLIRKEMKKYYMILSFVAKQRGSNEHTEEEHELMVEELYERLPRDTNIFLLNKNDGRICIKMRFNEEWKGFKWWHNSVVLGDGVFYGESASAIMLAVLK